MDAVAETTCSTVAVASDATVSTAGLGAVTVGAWVDTVSTAGGAADGVCGTAGATLEVAGASWLADAVAGALTVVADGSPARATPAKHPAQEIAPARSAIRKSHRGTRVVIGLLLPVFQVRTIVRPRRKTRTLQG
ncbi:MAG: hypothetical protein E6G50_12820 [Actinobacteria bacterium]|nr:MAG: hypothetical protein E6G50_12820 [Actinomycetota bacterium]